MTISADPTSQFFQQALALSQALHEFKSVTPLLEFALTQTLALSQLERGLIGLVSETNEVKVAVACGLTETDLARVHLRPQAEFNADTIYLPLIAQEAVLGFIYLEGANSLPATLKVGLPHFANHVALALTNVRAIETAHQLQVTLEQKMAERTADLTQANRQLQKEIAERRRVEDALDERVLSLAALYQISQDIAAQLDLEAAYAATHRAIEQIMSAEAFYIALVDEARQEFEVVYLFDRGRLPNRRYPMQQTGLNSYILRTGRTVRAVDDSLTAVMTAMGAKIATTQPGSVRSVLAVPLNADAKAIGVMSAQSYAPYAYTETHEQMLATLANQVAIAISNARLFQAAQVARLEAEQANRLKSRFLASMSHELRTPLNSIINFAYLLGLGVEGEINLAQADLLNRIGDSGRYLLGLINDLLDLAKIEAGKLELFLEELDLRPLINSTLSTTAGLLRNKPIELRQEVPDDLPTVVVDATRMRQVLLNLLSNATKFTLQGHITVRVWFDATTLTVSVQDTGLGIAPRDLPKVFEEFIQLENAARQSGGTGLGLPISKKFIEMHGGQMWVESVVGEGSRFFFKLPRHHST